MQKCHQPFICITTDELMKNAYLAKMKNTHDTKKIYIRQTCFVKIEHVYHDVPNLYKFTDNKSPCSCIVRTIYFNAVEGSSK